ncbi:ribosome-associated translation inhibitor RaiA [Alloacidobacterium dinghuense]|uniref:Ribosome hibernation promoting factor n=1 Tax=Alloacidobacterium dinghuense TaxID=2763107 RepID=A0A7G8BP18_9BACT|nr:ribosome-associated translation inhibitor RaiA [Alloacidobacterium dinghuense]QNI34288.1 ribosome-associated translation inhibitor RaiA [Alloacidobacterium dinghuense]
MKGAFTMQVEYTGRQVTVTRTLRTIAEESLERIAKILGKTTGAHIVLTAEKYRQMAEVTIKTRLHNIVAASESTNMETALRAALDKAETQAIRCKKKLHAKKRQPKEEKLTAEPSLARPKRAATRPAALKENTAQPKAAEKKANGHGRSKQVLPVTVHSFPAKVPIQEPHIVRSADSVALRPMTLEEAVKEAEFRDREVFVFRDHQGNVKVLHRKRDGKMELIEAP